VTHPPNGGNGGNGIAGPPTETYGGLPAIRDEWAVGDVRPLFGFPEEQLHLRDYWAVLLHHRWTVITFLATVVLTTMIVTLVTTPVYRSTVLIEIGPGNPNVVAFQDVVEVGRAQREFFQTQYDVLRSRNVAARVIDQLDLAAEPDFNPPPRRTVVRLVRGAVSALFTRSAATGVEASVVERQRLIEKFIDHVDVRPRRNSYLAEVSFLSPKPLLAQRVANAIAAEYVTLSLDQRLDSVQKGRGFIERQLDLNRAALERAEEKLQAFSKENAFLTADEEDNIEYKKLADLSDDLTAAQAERMAKEALLRQTERGDFTEVSAVMNHPVVNELLQEVARDEAEYSRLSKTFTAAYPKMQRLTAKINGLRGRVQAEVKRLAATLRADYGAALKKEQLLAGALEKQKDIVADLNQRAIDYKILKRQVDTERDIYRSLLQRLKEVEVTEGIKATNVHVLDTAEVPLRPHRPKPLLNLMLALFVGLAGGVGLAFFQEYLDNSIKSAEDVERHLRLPTLGALPLLHARRGQQQRSPVTPEMIAVEDPASVGAEAMRTLRAALFLATPAGPPQRILVTSARPQEGKTCLSINLAVILAQMGKRVVLIDTDLRRPRLHRVVGQEITPGLTNYLTGNADVPSIIRPAWPEKVPTLDVVVSGPTPPNPVELIDSREMMSFLEELCRRYDFVVADGPPSLGFADVPLLSRQMGGILLVVKCGETPRKVVKQAADYLARLRGKVLGVVLNQVSEKDRGYYSYYTYYGYYQRSAHDKGDGDEVLIDQQQSGHVV
jgi:capsular exopolysaccharide synthesis family protein